MKIHDAVKIWLETYKRNSVKPTTYDRLVTEYNMLLNYSISQIDVKDLTTEDIQRYINSLVDAGYSLSTIKKQYHLIGAYLDHAIMSDVISKPLHKAVQLPSQAVVKKKKREIDVYSDLEQEALRRVLNTQQRDGYAAVIIMLEAGLRVGEALSLTWNDILWNRRAVRINKTLARLANKHQMYVQDGAKSYTSNRTVPLSTAAMQTLNKIRGNSYNGDSYVFHDENGLPISYNALRYQIKIACNEAHVPYKGMHVFRHTFATNCYYRGCDVKILSKLLGHADVAITYNIYVHLFGDALEEMRSVIS